MRSFLFCRAKNSTPTSTAATAYPMVALPFNKVAINAEDMLDVARFKERASHWPVDGSKK